VDGSAYPPAPVPQTDALPSSPWVDLACGDPAPTVSPAAPLTLEHTTGPLVASLAAPAELDFAALLSYTGVGRLRASAAAAVTLWVVQDGVVLGSLRPVEAGGTRLLDLGVGVAADASQVHRLALTCAGPGDAPPLVPGEYVLHPELQVGGRVALLDGSAPRPFDVQRVIGSPVPLTVTP
jgi:hypothetical protein